MSNELATRKELTGEEIALVKQTICRGATDDELRLFIHHCNRTGLDPFAKQIYAVKRWDSQLKRETLAIQTGIDGYRLIADRTGLYAGNDDPVYDREDGPHPNKATVTVYKLVNGQRVPFTRSARWSEFVQTTKNGDVTRFWAKMPYLMLGKVAEALALRAAFPQELSGIYTTEEMGQADNDHAPAVVHVEQPKALPARGGQHDPAPAETGDPKLYGDLVAAIGESQSMGELTAVSDLIKAQHKRLSMPQLENLRRRYGEIRAKLEAFADEESPDVDVPA